MKQADCIPSSTSAVHNFGLRIDLGCGANGIAGVKPLLILLLTTVLFGEALLDMLLSGKECNIVAWAVGYCCLFSTFCFQCVLSGTVRISSYLKLI